MEMTDEKDRGTSNLEFPVSQNGEVKRERRTMDVPLIYDTSVISVDEFRKRAKLRAWGSRRPKNYFNDCVDRPRPCPWIGCKFHLLVDVTHAGNLVVNGGERSTRGRRQWTKKKLPSKRSFEEEVMESLFDSLRKGWPPTCTLDVAEDPEDSTLDDVGEILNVSRERIRQLQAYALEVLRDAPAQRVFKHWREDVRDEHSVSKRKRSKE